MENEENRGLIDKKASEDQWAGLDQFNFGSPLLFSLSHTLGHLEFSWSTLPLEQESDVGASELVSNVEDCPHVVANHSKIH